MGNRCAIGIDEVDNQGHYVLYLLLTKRFLCCSAPVDTDTAAKYRMAKYEAHADNLTTMATSQAKTTALHIAAKESDVLAAGMLLDKGADINSVDKDGWTPLHTAVKYRSKDVVQLLLDRHADVKTTSSDGRTPLHLAAQYDNDDATRLLIGKGAAIEATDSLFCTALHVAAWANSFGVASLLLGAGANIEATLRGGGTALHVAAKMIHYETACKLLDRRANVHAVDKNGMTALHMVASSYTYDADRLHFLSKAKTPHAHQKTRLPWAAQEHGKDVAQLLLKRGANVNAIDKAGRTSLDIVVSAVMDDHTFRMIDEIMSEHWEDYSFSMSGEIMSEQWEATLLELPKLLLSRKAHPSLANKDGKMPIHIAAETRMQKKLKELLKQNWQADPKTVPPAVELEDDGKREQEVRRQLCNVVWQGARHPPHSMGPSYIVCTQIREEVPAIV